MPSWHNVKKVIIIPDSDEPDGCTSTFVRLIGFFALAGLVLYGCPRQSSVQQAPTTAKEQPVQRSPQMQFAPVLEQYQRPYPLPMIIGRHPTNGDLIFNWEGRRWVIPDAHKPYRYLCVVNGMLKMCWPEPPNPTATPCTRNSDNLRGWCWRE